MTKWIKASEDRTSIACLAIACQAIACLPNSNVWNEETGSNTWEDESADSNSWTKTIGVVEEG